MLALAFVYYSLATSGEDFDPVAKVQGSDLSRQDDTGQLLDEGARKQHGGNDKAEGEIDIGGGIIPAPAPGVNKVQAVHDVLEDKAAADLDPDENKAEEYDDERMYDKDAAKNGGDSDQAAESLHHRGADKNKHHAVKLPVKDGSLFFKGPTNDRQKAVVEAFQVTSATSLRI